MRIILATGIYPPEIGGPAGYVKGIATEFVKQGHEVTVVTYGDEKTEIGENYQVKIIKKSHSILVRYAKYAYGCFKLAYRADVVYAQGPVSEGFPAALASIFARKPFILKIVGDFAWEQYMQGDSAKSNPESLDEFLQKKHQRKIRMYEIVERWTAKRAKRIIVASQYMRESIAKWGVDKAKIQVIYNSIEFKPFHSDVDYRLELNLPKNKKIIITAGRIIYWKRLDIIIRCLTTLGDDYIFVIAGDGPMVQPWKRLAQELGVEKRIIWLGRVDRGLLAKYIKSSNVFVIPSCLETFSFVLLEAVQQGCPCVISDRGGMVEVGGLFKELVKISPFEKIDNWVKDITVQSNVAHQIPKWPMCFSHEYMVAETLKVFYLAKHLSVESDVESEVHPHTLKVSLDSSLKLDNLKRILSISLERKLFEPGKVRDRIVEQLKDFESVIIVFAKQKFDEQIAPNVRVISTHSWHKLFYVWDALVQAWKIRNTDIKVVITQDPVETGLVGAISARLCNSALAVQDHGYHFHGKYYYQESFLNHFRYWLAKWLVKRADAIRVVSQRTEDALVNLGLPLEKIIRFPLNIITNNQSSITNNQLPITNNQSLINGDASVDVGRGTSDERRMSYFLLVCRFVPIKRIDLAIHAFSLVLKQDPDVKLKIVGAGPLEGQVKQWIGDFELQDRVEIIPWTDNLTELYQGAVATLITSDGEGFGMTAVESLMCHTPVIMTNVGCAHEVVKNGENGYIVPVGDVIALSLAMQAMLRSRLVVQPLAETELKGNNTFGEFVEKAIENHDLRLRSYGK